MKRTYLFARLALALALVTTALAAVPQASAGTTPFCIQACFNAPRGKACSAIRCRCMAEGFAEVRCTDCSDNDYRCFVDGRPI